MTGRIRINMGVASLACVSLFSRDIERMIVPTAISQPDNERAVSGVSCQGKLGINKPGNKKIRAAPKVNKPPIIAKTIFNPAGKALSGSAGLEDALLSCHIYAVTKIGGGRR
jgi:hypothetical protein